MIENLIDKMDFQDQVSAGWNFGNEPLMEFLSPNQRLLGSVRRELQSDPRRSARGSFAMEARMRLDQLKSGCGSSHTAVDVSSGPPWNQAHQRETPGTVLDLVELLEVDDEEEDEGRWLHAPTETQDHVDNDSALTWCRQVLDNPGPQVEAACRLLMSKLNQRPQLSHRSFTQHTGPTPPDFSSRVGDSSDCSERNDSSHSISSTYRLQDITDVHIVARLQEASLRQEFISTPNRVSPKRIGSDPQQPARSSAQHSPKLTRLHQQVTQFKLMRLAQNHASPGRTGSPLRTSLRSLQAVRNSRSLDTEDGLPVDAPVLPAPGESPSVTAPVNFSGRVRSVKDSPVQLPAVRRLLRSQSLSPHRTPQSPRGYRPTRGRVFALTEPTTSVPWSRPTITTRR